MDKEKLSRLLERRRMRKEIWEKAVDTQMHFNEMSQKTRQLGLSFVVGALALAIAVVGKGEGFEIIGYRIDSAAAIILISAIALLALRFLDTNLYHNMLRGAVAFGLQIEDDNFCKKVTRTEKGMTQLIKEYSQYGGKPKSSAKTPPKPAQERIKLFYNVVATSLVLIAVALQFGGNAEKQAQITHNGEISQLRAELQDVKMKLETANTLTNVLEEKRSLASDIKTRLDEIESKLGIRKKTPGH